MARTMTVDLGNELRHYVEDLVETGDYRSNSEVLRESLRLLCEKQAASKLEQLRHLIKVTTGEYALFFSETPAQKQAKRLEEKSITEKEACNPLSFHSFD